EPQGAGPSRIHRPERALASVPRDRVHDEEQIPLFSVHASLRSSTQPPARARSSAGTVCPSSSRALSAGPGQAFTSAASRAQRGQGEPRDAAPISVPALTPRRLHRLIEQRPEQAREDLSQRTVLRYRKVLELF